MSRYLNHFLPQESSCFVKNNYRHKACPFCISPEIRKTGNITYKSPVEFSTHLVDIEFPPELWKCNHCKSWFSQNIVPDETALRLYSQGSSSEKWSRRPFEERKPAEVIEALSGLFTEKTNVLDIGCNTGEFLDFAKSRGCKTSGIEPSIACRDIIESKGHKYYSSFADTGGSRFDVITAFDLIEHLYDIHSFMNCCADRLEENGVLVICTGDVSSLSARISKSSWWYVSAPEHIIFPSKIYFYYYSGFRVSKLIRTYAAVNYKKKYLTLAKDLLKSIIKNHYTGLPSLGPDHILLFLTK